MPSVFAAQLPGTRQKSLTASLKNFEGSLAQVPGGLASPCAPAGRAVVHDVPVTHCGRVTVPNVMVAWPLVQKERSPCLAASMATVTKPFNAKLSATVSMSARPRPRPWRKTTTGAHFPNAARGTAHAGTLADFGVAMSTLMVSSAVVPEGTNAPVAGSSRLNVVIFVSRISLMLGLGTAGSTPYFVNAAAGVRFDIAAVGPPVVAGENPDCVTSTG